MRTNDARADKPTDDAQPPEDETQYHVVCHACAYEELVALPDTARQHIARHSETHPDHDAEYLEVSVA